MMAQAPTSSTISGAAGMWSSSRMPSGVIA
jgi:hypothetical protein